MVEVVMVVMLEMNVCVSDLKYFIYFKMLKMGVFAQAVRNKMNFDGVDVSVLDGWQLRYFQVVVIECVWVKFDLVLQDE